MSDFEPGRPGFNSHAISNLGRITGTRTSFFVFVIDCVYMLEHNHVMNISNEDFIHVNRFIQSASPKGSSHDRISEVDTIAGLEPVLDGYLPACVLDRMVLPGVHVLRMLQINNK